MYSLSVLNGLLELLPPLPVSPVCSDWSGRCEARCCEKRTGFRVGDIAKHSETHPEHTQTLTAEVKTISVAWYWVRKRFITLWEWVCGEHFSTIPTRLLPTRELYASQWGLPVSWKCTLKILVCEELRGLVHLFLPGTKMDQSAELLTHQDLYRKCSTHRESPLTCIELPERW